MLKVNDRAPVFQAESTMGPVNLGDVLGKQPIVLIFYPINETPICTKQLCSVRDSKRQYSEYNALVLGINKGKLDSHQKFADNHQYDFPLVSDVGEKINQLYHVGKVLFGLYGQHRVVYVIDLQGNIVYARKGNRPTYEILEAIKTSCRTPNLPVSPSETVKD